MEERRRFVRLDTRLDVSYTVRPAGSVQQTLVKNLGGGGICLFADQVRPPGTCLQVSVKLPEREQPVHFTVEVVWSDPYEVVGGTERKRAVELGVRFLDIAPQDQEAIMQHVILGLRPPSSS